jgi:hypothetical protein
LTTQAAQLNEQLSPPQMRFDVEPFTFPAATRRARLAESRAACERTVAQCSSADRCRNVIEELTEAGVRLNIGGSLHDPTDPLGRLPFNKLGMIAEFEPDFIRPRHLVESDHDRCPDELRAGHYSPPEHVIKSSVWFRGPGTHQKAIEAAKVRHFGGLQVGATRSGTTCPS